MLFQIPGKAKPGQSNLQHDYQCHELYDELLGTEHQKPVHRTGQIIGIKG